jgi:hypothetical protein
MNSTHRSTARGELLKDLVCIILGAISALVLSQLGVIDHFISFFGNTAVASFVAGIFFTSIFTIAPASVALGHVALHASPHVVAWWGALGAMCGDVVLFYVIRDRFSPDIMTSFDSRWGRRITASFHTGFMKWLAPVLGGLIIASPLPDEIGLSLLGLSRTRLYVLVPISFIGNLIGIYATVWFSSIL